ncbi:H-NS histone family protein [Rosenbergiella collisarenosi]|uniref:H-NS family histone-like protein n=1 Tax=Rosenbergiella collisarenosi TaxID=1544695 RepID=UPI001BD985B2|nr:H-NS family nucleoid-associated regulatory protein [Rosenbergiella collisarenosi]MBT0722459.1 H-NS histone family protein [Rosenbergiella collisarenosi]
MSIENTKATLSNIRSLRVLARESELSWLEDALGKLTTVINEKKEEIKLEEQARAEKAESIKEVLEIMNSMGVSAEELYGVASGNGVLKAKASREQKYQYTDDKGRTKYWTGQGRTPKAIAEKIEAGASLDDFLIQ